MKNKQTEWPNRLIIPRSPVSAALLCKVVSVSEFSFFDEGEVRLAVSDLLRCKTKTVKLYLSSRNIVVGSVEFQFKISPHNCSEEWKNEWPTLRINGKDRSERKSVSLPQIGKPAQGMQRARESKERPGAASSCRKSPSRQARQTPAN